jgi:hypothetical protein
MPHAGDAASLQADTAVLAAVAWLKKQQTRQAESK